MGFYYCGRWVNSSRRVIYGCPRAFSLVKGASQYSFDENSAVRAPHWQDFFRSAEAVSPCCHFGIVEQEVCCCVNGSCKEHNWQISRSRHSYSIFLPAGNASIWCGLHYLYLVMQRVSKLSSEGQFYSKMNNYIGHLRRKSNLISDMRLM